MDNRLFPKTVLFPWRGPLEPEAMAYGTVVDANLASVGAPAVERLAAIWSHYLVNPEANYFDVLSHGAVLMVFNAPRPLVGKLAWQGPFRHGLFYAACWSDNTYAIDRNRSLDGWPVHFISNTASRWLFQRDLGQDGYTEHDYLAAQCDPIEELQARGYPWLDKPHRSVPQ